MADDAEAKSTGSDSAGSGATAAAALDATSNQIREVAKWLIGAFAAIGVALAAGSQLADVGSITGLRLIAAFAAILVVLAGIAAAILFAVKVLTPVPVGLKQLADDAGKSDVGKAIAADPSLLLGHGESIPDFAKERAAALEAEDAAWDASDAKPDDEALQRRAQKASDERERVDDAMVWLLSFARYTETAQRFKNALLAMFIAATVAAFGIAGFAWAAHPKAKSDTTPASVVPPSPAAIEIQLNQEGRAALSDDLGATCDLDHLEAVAVGGTPDALDVVTEPTSTCQVDRFTMTDELGSYESLQPPATRPNPKPPFG